MLTWEMLPSQTLETPWSHIFPYYREVAFWWRPRKTVLESHMGQNILFSRDVCVDYVYLISTSELFRSPSLFKYMMVKNPYKCIKNLKMNRDQRRKLKERGTKGGRKEKKTCLCLVDQLSLLNEFLYGTFLNQQRSWGKAHLEAERHHQWS